VTIVRLWKPLEMLLSHVSKKTSSQNRAHRVREQWSSNTELTWYQFLSIIFTMQWDPLLLKPVQNKTHEKAPSKTNPHAASHTVLCARLFDMEIKKKGGQRFQVFNASAFKGVWVILDVRGEKNIASFSETQCILIEIMISHLHTEYVKQFKIQQQWEASVIKIFQS